jgi:hypothetical protein
VTPAAGATFDDGPVDVRPGEEVGGLETDGRGRWAGDKLAVAVDGGRRGVVMDGMRNGAVGVTHNQTLTLLYDKMSIVGYKCLQVLAALYGNNYFVEPQSPTV